MRTDWQAFVDEVTWFPPAGAVVDVGPTRAPGEWNAADADFGRLFPNLHRLLTRARVTPVSVDGEALLLFTWLAGDESRAWLAPSPVAAPGAGIFSSHVTLLRSFGGIVERREPLESWLLNQEEVLTEREAQQGASFVRDDYGWAFESVGGKIPVDLDALYSVAREANGNHTFCDRTNGKILLFAPDHDFTHVTPLAGCPDYTLYELEGAPRFEAWVELVAQQWLEGV
ncbi:MAG: hypothetical protein JWM74_5762 [Myxococcaceae bacterium]|nr:hypothetical protein [Myxococcaceae bacterium]